MLIFRRKKENYEKIKIWLLDWLITYLNTDFHKVNPGLREFFQKKKSSKKQVLCLY